MSNDINLTEGTITEVLNDKVDLGFGNVPSNSVGFARCSTEVTNCITEIPQRIKYTLEDGTLTIKAGSVVIVPYGTEDLTEQYPKGATFVNDSFKVYDTQFSDNKFFVRAELKKDITQQNKTASSNERFAYIPLDNIDYPETNGYVNFGVVADMLSGTTSDISKYSSGYFYDIDQNRIIAVTTKNIIVMTLGLFIGDYVQNEGLKNIKQYFNGMGYFGSTVWVDKGVKGLIPNGRNEDGSLSNVEITTNNVLTRTVANDISVPITLFLNPTNTGLFIPPTSQVVYDEINNIIINNVTGERYYSPQLAIFDATNGVISNFNPKQPFRTLGYNDKSEISSWAMPSGRYISFTIGASDTTYTAPANGWFGCTLRITANGIVSLDNITGFLYNQQYAPANTTIQQYVPVKKSDLVRISYTQSMASTDCLLYFVYAEGEQ